MGQPLLNTCRTVRKQKNKALSAIDIAIKGDAAGMAEKPLKNKPAKQEQDKGGE